MATVIPQATHNSSPGMTYYMDAEQTGGSGTQRTIKITLYLKCGGSSSASWYGYPVNWKGRIHNSYSGFMTVKGTESWNGSQGFRSFTWTATVDVGTTASTNITVGFETDSYNGSSNWDLVKTGSFTVDKTNTAPYFTSGEQWLRIRPGSDSETVFNGYYPENIPSLYIDWGYASDDEGGTIYYSLNQSVNGGGWSQVDWGTDRAHGVQIGSGNEGQRLQYYVDARDNGGMWSNKVYSATITKNTLIAGSFSGNSNDLNYNSTSVTLHINAGSNTDGSPVYYMCYSDNITVYNQQETTSPSQTITIWRSGDLPSGPYIKFDDLKNYFAGSSYNGRLHVGLRTRNEYGTYKWNNGSIGVDLRTNPNPATNQQISTSSSESTIYKKVAFANNYYFLPDGSGVVRVKWSAGSGKLGESVSYELYVAYGSGSWQKLADLPSNTLYYNHVISKQKNKQQFKYLIRTKTSYGYYTDVTTPAQNLDYYNTPNVYVGVITRTSYTAEVKITVKSDSSIPNISTVGTWECRNTGEMSTLVENPNGNLSSSQAEQILKIDPLFGEFQHVLMINYKDNTGFSDYRKQEITIPANQPVFFINKYGAGINGSKADSDTALSIKGSVLPKTDLNGTESYTDTPTGLYLARSNQSQEGFAASYFTSLGVKYSVNREFQLGANNSSSILAFRTGHVDNSGGTGTGWTPWKKIYHEGFKPTPSDIGAAPYNHTHNYIPSDGKNINFNNDQGIQWTVDNDSGKIYFHADTPSSSSYIRYQVADDLDESHQFGGYHWQNGWKSWAVINNEGIYTKRLTASVSGDNAVAHKFDIERGWEFRQGGSGAGTSLDLVSLADGKYFRIMAPSRSRYASFYATEGSGVIFDSDIIRSRDTCYVGLDTMESRKNFVAENRMSSGVVGQAYFSVMSWGGNPAAVMEVTSNRNSIQALILQGGTFFPNSNGACLLGQNANKWSQVWASNGTIQSSDAGMKDNIEYITNDPLKKSFSTEGVKYYNFIKNMRFASWTWKENNDDLLDNLGFIAQDIVGTEIGDKLLYNDGENPLGFSTSNYITITSIALQQSINKIEALETELSIIKEKIGII